VFVMVTRGKLGSRAINGYITRRTVDGDTALGLGRPSIATVTCLLLRTTGHYSAAAYSERLYRSVDVPIVFGVPRVGVIAELPLLIGFNVGHLKAARQHLIEQLPEA
jgi:hypothetical protein